MSSAPGVDNRSDAPARNQANRVTLRKRWGLSQKQFASLFMTTARTVKRWEAGRSRMTPHQQNFLGVFARYVQLSIQLIETANRRPYRPYSVR
jgi:DNA-binding transcriptional regulator YiaG